jgi:dolichyl-phosphate-mannose-protein mannosyltransferase
VKKLLLRIFKWEYIWLCLIVIATLAMHFSIVDNVKDPILDEAHYAGYFGAEHEPVNGDAYSIIQDHKDLRPEHPPLSKLFIVGGILALGDNPWGWRVPSIIMGTIGIGLFFFICRKLGMSRRAVNFATFLMAFENFSFLMASVAMLDVFFVTLMMAFFLLYLHRRYVLSGIFIGMSAVAKLFAATGTPTLLIHWLFTQQKSVPRPEITIYPGVTVQTAGSINEGHSKRFIWTVILAPVSFLAWMALFDFSISRTFQNPLARVQEMLSLSGSLKFSNVVHPALSRPWSWLLNYEPMAFWYSPHYTGAISLSVWIFMIPVVLYMLYRAAKKNDAGLFGFAWFLGTFLVWIPISILTDRVSFIFYFYPTIGALCLGLGLGLNEALEWASSRRNRVKIPVVTAVIIFFLFHIANFVVLTSVFIRS